MPLGQHLAEKLHAYTRTYGGGRQCSRVKDLVDIVLIRSLADFVAPNVRDEIDRTFLARDTDPIPERFPSPPADWATTYRKLASEVGIDPDLSIGHRLAADFLDPVLSRNMIGSARWSSAIGGWTAGEVV